MIDPYLLETMNWSSWRTCTKMKHISKLFLIEILYNFPEPLDNVVRGRVWRFISCINFPIINIDERNSIKNHFHLIRLKNRKKLSRNYFIHPFLNGIYWLLYHIHGHHLNAHIHIEEFVLIIDLGILPIFHQLYFLNGCPCILIDHEISLQIFYIFRF